MHMHMRMDMDMDMDVHMHMHMHVHMHMHMHMDMDMVCARGCVIVRLFLPEQLLDLQPPAATATASARPRAAHL